MYEPHKKNAAWRQTVVDSLSAEGLKSPFGEPLPRFPEEALQSGTTGLSGVPAIDQAFAFYEDILSATGLSAARFWNDWKLVDFGACWGRITRLFMRELPLKNITGLDVDPDFVMRARDLFGVNRFQVCGALPPTNIASQSQTLVTAYSVFSHLAEQAAMAWMEEFARILKPGGFLAFTSRHDSFLDYCQSLRGQPNLSGYSEALSTMFADFDAARSDYRDGKFVFSGAEGVTGGGPRTNYGEAFVPEAYVVREYGRWFDLITAQFAPERYDQMLFVLRRKERSF